MNLGQRLKTLIQGALGYVEETNTVFNLLQEVEDADLPTLSESVAELELEVVDLQASAGLSLDLTLTSAEFIDSYADAVELIPAPGAGYAILVKAVLFSMAYDSVPYNLPLGDGVLEVTYNSTSMAEFSNSALISASNQVWHSALPASQIDGTYQIFENEAVLVGAAGEEPADGDSPITIRVFYDIVSYPL